MSSLGLLCFKNAIKRLENRCFRVHGAPGAIRTRGLPLRRRTLYPAELRAHRRERTFIIMPRFARIVKSGGIERRMIA